MREQLDALIAQGQALMADARQRALLTCLVALGLIQTVLVLSDHNARRRMDLQTLQTNRLRAEALAEAARDQQVSVAAAAAMNEARGLSYRAPTFALARLKAEQDLARLVEASGVQGASVRTDPDLLGEGAIRYLTVTIEGRLDWPEVLDWLETMGTLNHAVSADGFALARGASRQFRLSLQVALTQEATRS